MSSRARRYVSSLPFMRAVAVSTYGGLEAVEVVTVERPEIVNDDEVSHQCSNIRIR